jgi:hypothetical protein
MRRCGKACCLVLIGVLAAATVASGAFAARGGRQGIEHGKAKGHTKHAVAAPLLSSQPAKASPRIRAEKPNVGRAEENEEVASPPGAQVRHNHLTICHRTGSGRYIVISPNVNGATNGHLKHHDDFVYVDGCERPVSAPKPDPAPAPRPKPLPEGTSFGSAPAFASGSARDLPFTGLPVGWVLLAGALLAGCGVGLRKAPRS